MTQTPIAIIGLSGRYPGGAITPAKLWQNLKAGVDAIVESRGDRWDRGYLHSQPDRAGRFYTFEGGFLDAIDGFDAEFFGMSPREARQVDPQQRLLLELAWEAMEDAALIPRDLGGSRTGVFVGLSSHDYSDLVGPATPDAYSNTGVSFSIASNRISYVFDFHGPSMTIDTACSSGMVGVHQACRSLEAGECDLALVGAANIMIAARPWMGFAKASMLSPAGRCKSFDADGAGYVRSEGGGMFVLKLLDAAERDGNTILGVLVATGVNSDGRTMGLSLPSGAAQAALMNEVYAQAGVSPDDVFYFEAHGTGTAVGDPIECEAIARALAMQRSEGKPLPIGSIKSNIGHLEPAAGIAGLTKVLLAIKHREVPANLHFETPNPKIDFAAWRLAVVDRPLPLPETDEPLHFGINSFGFGGTNAHAVLREHRGSRASSNPAAPLQDDEGAWNEMLLLSAQSPQALAAMAADWAVFLPLQPAEDWQRIRATAARCRTRHAHRLALHASTAAEAADLLRRHAAADGPSDGADRIATGRAAATGRTRVAFVYSGNGPQWWHMGHELLQGEPRFRAAMQEVDGHFSALAGWSLIDELQRDEASSRMAFTEIAQPTLFALQVALTMLLRDGGIEPDAVFGHSVGEAAAAWASGALSLAQATAVIFHRSTTQARTAGLGRMAALGVSAAEAAEAIAEIGGFLEIAAVNGPRAVTVAGDPARLQSLCDRITEAGRFARVLTLDYPFHTAAMDGIRADLLQRLDGLAPRACRVPFVSTVEGGLLEGAALGAEYWWRNVREPLRFADAVDVMLKDQAITAFIEIGPHPVLRDYIGQCAKQQAIATLLLHTLRRPSAGKPSPEKEALRATVLACHANGIGDVAALFERPARPAELPVYPWQRSRHWRGEVALPDVSPPTRRDHPLLGWRVGGVVGQWESLAETELLPYLLDHRVQDAVVFPAAGYIEMALAAAQRLLPAGTHDIEDFDILKPLVIAPEFTPALQFGADPADGTWEIRSRLGLHVEGAATLHVRGRITRAEASLTPPSVDLGELMAGHLVAIDQPGHYREAARRGMPYGPLFQGVRVVHLDAAGAQGRSALAEIEVPRTIAESLAPYRSHPAVLDACLQVLITLMGQSEARACAFIPVRIGRLRSFAELPARLFCRVVVTGGSARSGRADFMLWDEQGRPLMSITETRFQKVDFRAGTPAPRITERWRPDGAAVSRPGAAIGLPSPAQWADRLAPARGSADPSIAFDALIGAYAAQALAALGARNGSFTLARLQRRAGVADEHLPLLGALLAMAEADGLVQRRSSGWSWAADREPADPAPLWASLMRASPKHVSELMLIAQAGERLPALLQGAALPPSREANAALLDALADSAPYRANANRQAAAALQQLVASWPAGRPIRVLELSGGSGALTAALLPLLPPLRTDYVFSDRDGASLDRATQRFGAFRFLRCLPLDIDRASPEPQALAGQFDLVLCGDGLHAAAEPVAALRRARELLSPGGLLMLLESRPQRLAELVFGQAPAWWRNGSSPLVPADDWLERLAEAGFVDARALPGGDASHHGLLLAQAPAHAAGAATSPEPAAPRRHWLLLVDGTPQGRGYAQAVAAALERRGQRVMTRTLGELAGQRFDTAAALADVIGLAADEIVHLAGIATHADDGESMLALQDLRCLSTLSLIQAIKAATPPYKPRLQIALHGAFNGPADAGPTDPMQAPVWGLARVVANEHPDLAPKLIDQHTALDAEGAEALVDELLRGDGETEVLLMPGQRFVNRMQQTDLAELTGEVARDKPASPAAYRLESTAEGGLDGLGLRRVERRQPRAGQVEIAVRAAGLNFRDVLWAMGMLPEEAVEHGFSGATIGMECAGEIVAVGAGVDGLRIGDRVIGFATGCFASHVTTQVAAVAKVPAGLSFEEAATLPTAFLTALYALDHLAHLQPGERVLIHGAAGGVGLAAVQVAKLRGAVVFGTAGNDDKQRLLRLAGVDHVLNSRSLAFADEIMSLTGGQGVDVVLNSLAGEAITKNLQILRPFGRLLEIGKRDFYANTRIGLRPFRNNLSYFGIDADTLLIERPDMARQVLQQMRQLFDDGLLRPLPYQALPIGRAAQAFRLMQQSRHVGKIVITMPGDSAGVLAAGETLPSAVNAATGIRGDSTYLVTGGLGGFGLATARWLVSQGARHLALVSRRGATTDEALEGIAAMQALGASVKAYAADVSIAAEVAHVLSDLRLTMPPLRGVVHAAMVLDDAPILKLDGERLRRSLAPKAVGAWLLHQQTLADPIELFVMYSSGTTVVGNPGQGNYVAANIFLEALAQTRRAAGLPALAVGWGAIKDVGVLARNTGVEEMLQSRTGMGSVASAEALAELGLLIAAGTNRISVAQFNLQRLGALLAGTRTPRFAPLATQSVIDALSEKRETLGERLLGLPQAEHRDVVVTCLRDHLGRILGTGAAQIDVERSLSDMGLDSLMAVELAESLERDVGRPVSVMQMIQAGSPAAIADLLMAGMQAQPA